MFNASPADRVEQTRRWTPEAGEQRSPTRAAPAANPAQQPAAQPAGRLQRRGAYGADRPRPDGPAACGPGSPRPPAPPRPPAGRASGHPDRPEKPPAPPHWPAGRRCCCHPPPSCSALAVRPRPPPPSLVPSAAPFRRYDRSTLKRREPIAELSPRPGWSRLADGIRMEAASQSAWGAPASSLPAVAMRLRQ